MTNSEFYTCNFDSTNFKAINPKSALIDTNFCRDKNNHNLDNSQFYLCTFKNTMFNGTKMTNCVFTNFDASNVNSFENLYFWNSNLEKSKFFSNNFTKTSFHKSSLKGVWFINPFTIDTLAIISSGCDIDDSTSIESFWENMPKQSFLKYMNNKGLK